MRRLACLVTAGLALASAGCDRTGVAQVRGRTVQLVQTAYRIAPQHVRVGPGRVTFEVHNTSRMPHNWVLERGGTRVGRITTLLPGESGELQVRLRKGTYVMRCAVGHDDELGEHGTVIVR